jgi:aspartate kinase
MGVVVKKFGGTSVGDVGRIKHVARSVAEYVRTHPDDRVVVVASAMAGETNRLIALAKSCVAEPDPRELDVMLTTGEQVSVALVAMALGELGVRAKSMLAPQARIATSNRHTNAEILDIDPEPLRAILGSGEVPVVAGYQGTTESGDLTTLGRGGSDITAVAVAAALRASACYIYTDVPGVYSTDPRICRNARLLERVSHQEMLELASLGAKVLHPRSVYFAMRYRVPLVVLSTFTPGPGTWIVPEEALMEKPVVTGITHRSDEAKVTVRDIPGGQGGLGRLFGALHDGGIFVDMISQTGSGGGRTTVSFTVPDESSARALEIARALVPDLDAAGAAVDRDIAKVSVVGLGMQHHTGIAARMFRALEREAIEVGMVGTSEIKISVIVPRKYCELAVRTLHAAFLDGHPSVDVEIDLRTERATQ